ncbi:MAG TPA: lipocalin-like domain-containing protein [Burkholderiaceae bacterium]|nr:lipocalin-like domain-containing protein [Burkholderiaceae bacterium]
MTTDTRLVGTWSLERFEIEFQEDGRREPSLGARPSGRFMFTADGWTSSVIAAEDRRAGSTDAELAALMRSLIALSGRWAVDGNRLTIDVDISWNQAWTGGRQERFLEFRDDRLDISTAWMPSPWHPGGPIVRVVLGWVRSPSACAEGSAGG